MVFFTPKELAILYHPGNKTFDTWAKSTKKTWEEAAVRLNIAIAERLDNKPAVDEQTDDGQGFPLESP